MDRPKRQTATATPAKPGGLPLTLAQNRAGYLKVLFYPNRERGRRAEKTNRCSDAEMHKVYEQGVRAYVKNADPDKGDRQ